MIFTLFLSIFLALEVLSGIVIAAYALYFWITILKWLEEAGYRTYLKRHPEDKKKG